MASKAGDAVRQAVRDALASWYGPPPSAPPAGRRSPRAWSQTGVRTELSTTVFSSDPEEWVRYLTLPFHERFVPDIRVLVHRHRALKLVAFEPEHESSQWLATLLDDGLRAVRQ